MEPGVEHFTDLGLVNYVQHPSNKEYIVFRFADIERAETFQKGLEDAKIWFERDEDKPRTVTFYMFGVHYRDFKKVQALNFSTEAKHRNHLIKHKGIRYVFLLLVLAICALAVLGYCNRPTLDNPYNEQQLNQ